MSLSYDSLHCMSLLKVSDIDTIYTKCFNAKCPHTDSYNTSKCLEEISKKTPICGTAFRKKKFFLK